MDDRCHDCKDLTTNPIGSWGDLPYCNKYQCTLKFTEQPFISPLKCEVCRYAEEVA